MGKSETFVIVTEDGGRFCDCEKQGRSVKLVGKEGNLSIECLMAQIDNPKIAHSIRSRKQGRKYRQ